MKNSEGRICMAIQWRKLIALNIPDAQCFWEHEIRLFYGRRLCTTNAHHLHSCTHKRHSIHAAILVNFEDCDGACAQWIQCKPNFKHEFKHWIFFWATGLIAMGITYTLCLLPRPCHDQAATMPRSSRDHAYVRTLIRLIYLIYLIIALIMLITLITLIRRIMVQTKHFCYN